MSLSIPYDPSLVLGNLVQPAKLDNLISIAELEEPINLKQESLNDLILMRRQLTMTLNELSNMGIGVEELKPLQDEINELDKDVVTAAVAYGKAVAENSKKILEAREKVIPMNKSIESPLDYTRTQIRKMPLSSDSLKLDAQYFSYDENDEDASNTMAQIKSYISAQTRFLGSKKSAEVTNEVQSQISHQTQNHDVDGTLIITATCTHKDAVLLAPFILDVDKAIRVWNMSGFKSKIKMDDPNSVKSLSEKEGTEDEEMMQIISGATYGSSFVGMVHVLKHEKTDTSQKMVSVAGSLQGQMETGGWFAETKGGFGVDASFAKDVKNLLSSQEISSHISLITMGIIPTIKSREVQIGVKTFAEFDPEKMMSKLATLANATKSDQKSVADSAEAARTGGKMLAIRNAEIKSVMSGLDEIDDGKNQMLDINSLMTSFEDFVEKALAGDIGVPINFYLKPITAVQLAQMWVAKYYPKKYLAISGDDSQDTENNKEEES